MISEWKSRLRQTLDQNRRIVVLGIGNELYGDDAVGSLIARAVKARINHSPHAHVIDAGNAPENYTGVIRAFKPDLVLLIDAALMELPPGTIQWLLTEQITGISGSGHHLPLSVLSGYLASELDCRTALIGIQPLDLSFGSLLSVPVKSAKAQVIRSLNAFLLPAKE